MKRTIKGYVWMLLLCAGCASGPMKLADVPGPTRLNIVVPIDLFPPDRQRIDKHFIFTGATHPVFATEANNSVVTGEIWQRAFVGDPNHNAQFRIVQAALHDSLEGAGFVMRVTYIVDGELTYRNHAYQVHAQGSRAAAMNVRGAMREAVELAIEDAAKQATNIIDALK